jgi:hypothetical protein
MVTAAFDLEISRIIPLKSLDGDRARTNKAHRSGLAFKSSDIVDGRHVHRRGIGSLLDRVGAPIQAAWRLPGEKVALILRYP